MKLLAAWDRISRFPARSTIFNWCLKFAVPYTSTIGADVIELRAGYARLQLRDRRRVRNHLKSIHAVALMNLCEAVSGMALMSAIEGRGQGILVGFSIEYLKKARGTLHTECTVQIPELSARIEQELVVEVKNEAGDIVCRARARWLLQPVDASLKS
jgi:acyl-coenzyme A thioesterase PaaI-like protein